MKKELVAGLATGLFLVGMVGTASADIINVITNGDFEDGLNGWTIDNPDHHPLGTISIDIDGSGPLSASNAFYTQTAGEVNTNDVNISQSVSLIAGTDYSLFVNLAAYDFMVDNLSGGQITASLSGVTLDTFDFGYITEQIWEYGTLEQTFTAASSGLFNLNIYRPYPSSENTPYQYLDNVSLTYDDNMGPAPVPEPATMLLFGTGLAGLAGAARRKKAQKK